MKAPRWGSHPLNWIPYSFMQHKARMLQVSNHLAVFNGIKKTTVCIAKYFPELEAHKGYCLLFSTQKYSTNMTLSAFGIMAPKRGCPSPPVLWHPLLCHQLLGCVGPGPSTLPDRSQPILPPVGLAVGYPSFRREKTQVGEAGPSLLMPGPWHCFCCQSGCFLVAFGSLYFLCGFCGRFHPPVWSLSEALACQTSLFELVPGHLLGRWSQTPYI